MRILLLSGRGFCGASADEIERRKAMFDPGVRDVREMFGAHRGPRGLARARRTMTG
jgi:hypothetical protein